MQMGNCYGVWLVTVIVVCVVTVMLLICFFFLLNELWLKIWVRAGDSYSYEGVSAGIWVMYTGARSGGELVTLFGNIFSLSG